MDPYENIVEIYDLEHDAFDDDASFFANLVREGPVLEVGCGTGRIVAHLARAGLEVHGIDPSEAMLRAARERLKGLANAHVHQMSVQNISLNRVFPSVIYPLNVLWHLPDLSAQLDSLRQLRIHIEDGGMLVVDVTNPLNMLDRQGGNEIRLRFEARDGPTVVHGFSSADDLVAEQVLRLSLWYDRTYRDGTVKRIASSLRLRYTYRYELELMLLQAGFLTKQVYGSYDLEPYGADSSNLILVCVAR